MNGLIELDERLMRITSDADRIATCLEAGDLTSAVVACPGWDLRRLGVHTGFIHRWATHAVQDAAPPPHDAIGEPAADASGEELAAWMRMGAGVLVDVLAAVDPTAATWHPFPLEQSAWVWSRRQMMETAVHRWDAEVASTASSDLDRDLAVTGVEEYLDLGLPRVLEREAVPVPTATLHVHCTDDGLPSGAGEWVVSSEGGEYHVAAGHPAEASDAALRGSAGDMLLVLMGRADRDVLDIVGDPGIAGAWLDLPGW